MKLEAPLATMCLDLEGFQFPSATDRWDANWLFIGVSVSAPEGRWSFRDPCLDVSDVLGLAAWLDGVARGERPAAIEFTEPNLRFELVPSDGALPVVRVGFELSARPSWRKKDFVDGDRDCYLDIEVAISALQAAANDLRDQLNKVRRHR